MQRVIAEGPWSFDNQLVVLKKWEPGMRSDNVQFHQVDFWVQLWGLPFEYISGEISTIVGRQIGEVVDVDEKSIKEDGKICAQSACSDDPIPVGGSRLAEGVDDVVVMGCRREMIQAPNKRDLNLNGMKKAGMQLDSNLNVEFLESKDMGGSGPDLFAKGGPEGKALQSNLGDFDGSVYSQALEKASLGPLDVVEAQVKLGLSEAQLLEVSVQTLELEGQHTAGGDLFFRASSSHTTSKGRRGRGKGRVQAIHSRERKVRSSRGSTGGGLLGKRRSLTDCDVSEARYDDGVFKLSSLKEVNVGKRVEAASLEWPHQSP
ncbi:hypothetical protein Vadar_012940 [Vaccinium darrowii]|uniref:Uncharacterized protein n=1 Tax=Vaccinium darrowii TaxID=229202 RepID=A0ACB7ZC95_9ERIC|nr:hypothetical protein Vadar_012940 [Vaccinium darrowii]